MSQSNYAPVTLYNPGRLQITDYNVFKKIPGEKEQLKAMKKENLQERKMHYGADYKKHLNIPSRSLGKSVINSF